MMVLTNMQKTPDFRTEQKTWDAIAESFDCTRNKTWPHCIDFIKKTNHQTSAVDLGCGNGRHLIPLANNCNQAIGIDLSRKLLTITRQKLNRNQITNTTLFQASLTHIPLNSDSIDTALYIAALHNIRTKQLRIKSLMELKRILKKGGKALISVWARNQPRFQKKIISAKQNNMLEEGDIILYWRQHQLNVPRFYHLYTKDEFISDLKKAKLKIKDLKEAFIISKTIPDNYFVIVTP